MAQGFSIISLANEFSKCLRSVLTPSQIREAVKRNMHTERHYTKTKAKIDSFICHSHDFCDANDVMMKALSNVGFTGFDAENENHAEIWGAAWRRAKENGFKKIVFKR